MDNTQAVEAQELTQVPRQPWATPSVDVLDVIDSAAGLNVGADIVYS